MQRKEKLSTWTVCWGPDSPVPRQQRRRELGQLHWLITARAKVSAKTVGRDGRASLVWRHRHWLATWFPAKQNNNRDWA